MNGDRASEARRVVERALDGWEDGSGIGPLVDPYSIGAGGEGWAFVAERLHLGAQFGSQCTSYVVIKFPVSTPSGSMPRVDARQVQRLRAEYDRRQWLGDAPHLGHVPSLRFLDAKELGKHQHERHRILIRTDESTIPVLVTPLQGTRTGGTVPADLASLIPDDGCWSSREILNWTVVARGLARALWSMHGRGWAHNDIKPENVVLYESGGTWHDVNLIDFGLVEPDMPGTIFGREPGSMYYWRLERLQATCRLTGTLALDARQGPARDLLPMLRPSTEDLYALGVMLVEVLLGRSHTAILRDEARKAADKEAPSGASELARFSLASLKYAESIQRAVRAGIKDEPTEQLRVALRGASGGEGRAAEASPRSIAFLLCQSHLMRNPSADSGREHGSARPTLGVLRDFLTNVDTRLVALGDPQKTATRLLVNIGASPGASGLKQQRRRYYTVPPPNHRLMLGRSPEQAMKIDLCVELVSDGYVRHGIVEINRRLIELEQLCSAASPCAAMDSAYEVVRGLRLLVGVLLSRDRRYREAWHIIERWRARLEVFSDARNERGNASPREVVSWWLDCLQRRLWRADQREVKACHVFDAGQRLTGVRPPRDETTGPSPAFDDFGEQTRAVAWSNDDTLTKSMLHKVEVPDRENILKTSEDYQQSGKSTQEAVHASLQVVRWKLTRLQEDPSKLLLETMRMWTLAVGWALVADLHHEYASAMILAANRARTVFGRQRPQAHLPISPATQTVSASGQPPETDRTNRLPNVGTEATLVEGPGILATQAGPDGNAPPASTSRHLEEVLRRGYNIDGEAILSTAAECALAAASTYADIDSPLLAWRALLVAAECLSACEAPEQRVDAVRWLQFAKNDFLLHEQADPASTIDPARSTPEMREEIITRSNRALDLAINDWSERASKVYKNTAGTDPGAFLSKAMFGRYGAGIAFVTAGSLGVELASVSGEPRAGEVVKLMLDSKKSTLGDSAITMLEIECGLGHDCLAVGQMPGESLFVRVEGVWGIESMPWCERRARYNCRDAKRVEIHGLDIYESKWQGQHQSRLQGRTFDVVWMHDVLVRISDRKRVLERAYALLKPGGLLMMTDWVQTKQMSQENWRDLCEVAWLTGPETEVGYKQLLGATHFEDVDVTLHTEDMVKAFEWAATLPGKWYSGRNDKAKTDDSSVNMAETDYSSVLRTEQSFTTLLKLARSEKLGWIWVTARRPHEGAPPQER